MSDLPERGRPQDGLEALRLLGSVLVDPWYVVDADCRLVEYNAAFHALFPRAVARTLKQKSCKEALSLPTCEGDKCLRKSCLQSGPTRLDEVEGRVGEERLNLIVSASPLPLPDGTVGALIVLRNVTDDARVQERYQRMVQRAAAEHQELEQRLNARSRDLLAANDEINRLEQEVARLKRERL